MLNPKFLLSSLLTLLVIISSFGQAKISAERLQRYDAYFQKEIDAGRLPGVVTLLYRNGEKAHESALGFSDLSAKTPMRTDQIFFIQSMTKPIISTAFMMLYEEGHFFLTDPIANYLPEFKEMRVLLDPEGIIHSTTSSEIFDMGVDLGSTVSLDYMEHCPFRFDGKVISAKVVLNT